MSNLRSRRGFTMLTTLWLLSVGSVLAMAFALMGRDSFNATTNRVNLERARWGALGCARRAQAAIDEALGNTQNAQEAASAWRAVYTAIDASPLLPGCDIAIEAAGSRLDLNGASDESIARLVSAVYGVGRADSMSDAFGDWRDGDDVARPLGAEHAWYAAQSRVPPSNAPLADARELAFVRGFEDFGVFDSLVTTEPGRVSLATARATVLQSVPGISMELADRIVERRITAPITDLADMLPLVSEASAGELLARFADASRLTTPDPDAWILTARASAGLTPVAAQLEWRLVRAGHQVRVIRLRSRM
jgi:general secretion pathway protein K